MYISEGSAQSPTLLILHLHSQSISELRWRELCVKQVWLLLNRLLVDPKWRGKCLSENPARLGRVLELRKWIDEPLVDKLPFLKGLAFLLEQLAMGCREMTTPTNGTTLPIIEEVWFPNFQALKRTICLVSQNIKLPRRQRLMSNAETSGET